VEVQPDVGHRALTVKDPQVQIVDLDAVLGGDDTRHDIFVGVCMCHDNNGVAHGNQLQTEKMQMIFHPTDVGIVKVRHHANFHLLAIKVPCLRFIYLNQLISKKL
jgi:hypothetical protein